MKYLLILLLLTACSQVQTIEIANDTRIEIILRYGGEDGGINPITENTLIIHPNGTYERRFARLYGPASNSTNHILRDQLEELAAFIIDQQFFLMDGVYDCPLGLNDCKEKKQLYPGVRPTIIIVNIGDHRKSVSVTVPFPELLEYPSEIDEIASRIDSVT